MTGNGFLAPTANERLIEIFGINDDNLLVNPYAKAVNDRVKDLFSESTRALNPYTLVSSCLAAEVAVAAITKDNVYPGGVQLDKISANFNNLTVGGPGDVALSVDSNGNLETTGTIDATQVKIGGSPITATAAEINVLNNSIATTDDLNKLNAVTSTVDELNLLDGSLAGQIVEEKAVIYSSTGTINVNTPVANSEVANKQYVDNVAQGLRVKKAVKAASTGNIDLSVQIGHLDGVIIDHSDRILLKDQTNKAENGIYIRGQSSGKPERAEDFNSKDNIPPGSFTFVEQGQFYKDTSFVLINDVIDLDDTNLAIEFTQFSRAGVTEIDGNSGVSVTQDGNKFTVSIGQAVNTTSDVTFNSVQLNSDFDRQNITEMPNSNSNLNDHIHDIYAKLKKINAFLIEINSNIQFDNGYTPLLFDN